MFRSSCVTVTLVWGFGGFFSDFPYRSVLGTALWSRWESLKNESVSWLLLFVYIISIRSPTSPNYLKVKGCIIFVEILKVNIGASWITRRRSWKREMLDTMLMSWWDMHPWTPRLTFALQYLWPWAHGRENASNVPFTCLISTLTLDLEVFEWANGPITDTDFRQK